MMQDTFLSTLLVDNYWRRHAISEGFFKTVTLQIKPQTSGNYFFAIKKSLF